ncbi:glycosyltransferase family 4 protein [uncultured Zobellia sp.]|uniref:glycosyltransferase family 4 protein n=1 Tax=uncultured Zobellia sp. TaxID=255433 RepID=UPI0025996C02|nr:glycosyltransferase family 4 protein [uncultured Zobellia sp.]
MNKKKILFVHHSGGLGGAPKSMGYIIKNIDKSKYSPHLLNISEGPINDFFRKLPCKLTIIKEIRPFHGSYVVKTNPYHYFYGWFFLLPSIILAYRNLKRIKPDLIHLNSTCLFSFAIAAFFLKITTVCHVREPIRNGVAGWPLRFFNKAFVSGFIAISQFDLDSLRLKKEKNIPKEVIYNFVEHFSQNHISKENKFRQELKIKEEDTLILYLARFADSNGWRQLVRMAKKIVKEHDKTHFVLVGANNKKHFINTGSSNIRILGYRSDVDEILKGADIFICPFVLPHFARGVIEAAAYSIPGIGNDIGGVNELIKNNQTGLLYRNEPEFIICCKKMIKDSKLRQSLGQGAYMFAKENFNPDVNLKRTYEFYTRFIQ